jgi:hypothetical protein
MTTTTNLTKPTSPRRWIDLSPPVAAAICIFCLLGIAAIIGRMRSAPAVAVQPTPALPIILIATQVAVAPPTAVPAVQIAAALPANVTKRAIVVYGAPDLASAIGAVEAGRPYQLLARWGVDWLQVDISGSGIVYARTADLLDLPADLVDLAPTAAPVIVERPIYVAAPMPAAPTPAPDLYQTTQPVAPTLAPQELVILDRQQWALDAQRAGR